MQYGSHIWVSMYSIFDLLKQPELSERLKRPEHFERLKQPGFLERLKQPEFLEPCAASAECGQPEPARSDRQ